jgi:uncharacterized protein YyaL (SSP411 family)
MMHMSKTQPTNRLTHETSPYLLQHAHNPVDWYPWGDEAFEKAKAEDKEIGIGQVRKEDMNVRGESRNRP